MKAIHKPLTGLLIFQLLLAAGLYWQQQNNTAFEPQPLLQASIETVNKMMISDGEKRLEIIKNDQGQWQLPELNHLPADATQLADRIDILNNTQLGWPVSTTSSSHQRFEVNEDKFERRIELFQGDNQLIQLYLGTSPGFRKIHARLANEPEVFSIELNAFDFAADASEWLDKKILTLPSIDSVKTGTLGLEKLNEQWVFTDSNISINQDKAKQLISDLQAMSITAVADQDLDLSEATTNNLTLTSEGKEWTYQFYRKDNQYYLQRNDIERIFSISKLLYEQMEKISLAHLAEAEGGIPVNAEASKGE